jgi:hypothetical protein
MTHNLRMRFWFEPVLALVSLAALVLTLISRSWIETLTGLDPDSGSGATEWGIVAALMAVTISAVVMARVELKRALAATR